MNHLTRRDFLKLCGTSSVGLALAACGVNPTPTATSAPTNTFLPTNTALPTATATLTSTPMPTSTAMATATPTQTFTPPVPPLPALYVDGPYIKRNDTGKPVVLKGVNIADLCWGASLTFNSLYNNHGLKKVESWGMNLFRVALEPAWAESRLPECDKLIAFANMNGMYVFLTPFPSFVNPERNADKLPVPDDMVAETMGRYAERYKDKTNILYGLWNEPHPDAQWRTIGGPDKQWPLWMDAGSKVARAIRAKNPKSVLIVPGGRQWGRDLRYYQVNPFPFENIVYEVNDYWAPPDQNYSRDEWTWVIGKTPLLFGEFGGASGDIDKSGACRYQSDCDINYMRDVLGIVNNNPTFVHYAMWSLKNWGPDATLLPSMEPNQRGQLLLDDLTKYPPTRFR